MSRQRASEPAHSSVPILTDITLIRDPYPEVARRAYELFEFRGREHGHDLDDWFCAERELLRHVPLEVVQTPWQVTVRAGVFGFGSEELTVCVEPECLTIAGKKQPEMEVGDKVTFIDWSPDEIYCRVPLPIAVDPAGAIASLGIDVLRIELPALVTQAEEMEDELCSI